jgi:Potential Monad-binding region of RPAP3
MKVKECAINLLDLHVSYCSVVFRSMHSDITILMYVFQMNDLHSADRLPRNGHEFLREWRNTFRRSDERYDLLLRLCDKVEPIFRNEISCGLGELIIVLNSHYQDEDYEKIIKILLDLTKVNRFRLAVDFLNSSEKSACEQLFCKLRKTCELQNRQLDEYSLQSAYGLS